MEPRGVDALLVIHGHNADGECIYQIILLLEYEYRSIQFLVIVPISHFSMKNEDIVGEALASVLPQYDRVWFRVPHLLQLNLILLVPLLSSAVAGYDG